MGGVDSISPYEICPVPVGCMRSEGKCVQIGIYRYRACTWNIIPYVTDFALSLGGPGDRR